MASNNQTTEPSEKVESQVPASTMPIQPDSDLDTSDPSKTHKDVIDHARAAAIKEQKMTLMQGIRLYPKAIAWSILISTVIVMEGYDISLVNNFCMSLSLENFHLFTAHMTDLLPRCFPSVQQKVWCSRR